MTKKFLVILAICILFLAACGRAAAEYPGTDYDYAEDADGAEYHVIAVDDADYDYDYDYAANPGKIAIITSESDYNWGRDWIDSLIERHGQDNVIVFALSWQATQDIEPLTDMMQQIAANLEIGVLIVNPVWYETNRAMGFLREQRDDIFVVHINSSADIIAHNADLVLRFDAAGANRRVPALARSLGADTLVFFYDTMMAYWDGVEWEETYLHSAMRQLSHEAGLYFVEFDVEGYIQCGSSYHMFLERTIPMLIEKYGTDVAFFTVDNERLLWFWQNHGFVFVSNHSDWFGTADDIAWALHGYDDTYATYPAAWLTNALDEIGLRGQLAAMPMSMRLLFPLAAAEYGARWMHGEVSRDGIDHDVLGQIMEDIIYEHLGAAVGVYLSVHAQDGEVHENYVLVLPELFVP